MVDDRTLDERGGSSTATPVEPTIGRYRIEGKLGAGGMGVVYAAYDPELERRVALKLLAQSGASRASRERLLREARAMARLSHPNVVVVYEVGTTDDRDFVAMELVDGSSLDHWLEHDHPSRRAIIAAFVAAGRGLAAAHAAGIVHRDFKPHNVLRRRDGNIQVGDFGLAVDVADEPEPVEPRSRNTPSPLGGLTETGAVLGTPAYMAPEQWRGDTVGPAADQFAFCVALWEALAGALPYRGDHESLRAAVMRGPHELDATAIPRGLRAALSRGLAPDPARRWPSMSALLATIERTQRSVAVPIALGAATCAIVATIGILLVHRSADQAAASPLRCDAPVLDPDSVWPEGSVARLGAGQAAAANRLDRELDTWRTVRQLSCLSGDAGALKCLDGVLSQFDAVARAVTTAKRPVETSQLLDPIVCMRAEPPRLQRTLSDASRALIALMTDDIALESLTPEAADHLVADAANDPCARAFATMIAAGTKPNDAARRDELAVAETAAARCGADDVIARVALAAANDEILYSRTDDLALARLQRVEPAVMRVPDAELVGQLDLLRMREARSAHRIDDAIAHGEAAVAKFRERDCFDCVVS
ncbi:MAG TPA: serine/threonine-protein kinase, partial [Kofleriaceae bacterium]